jgi:hypothetical protein
MEAPPGSIVSRRATSGDNAKRIAVISCVNGAMDANRPGWNDDSHGDSRTMDKDFHYDRHSMPAFLGVVSRCLAPKYKLTIDNKLVEDCVSAMVLDLKLFVLNNTK